MILTQNPWWLVGKGLLVCRLFVSNLHGNRISSGIVELTN